MRFRLSCAIGLGLALAASANAQQLDEYRLKAAFLYNFAKFVDWPADEYTSPSQPFTICVLGKDPFGHSLDDVVAGKEIGGHPLTVRRIPAAGASDARESAACQILFVSPLEHKKVLSNLAATSQPGVLTVGEVGSPAADAVIINFILESGRVRFEINLAVAEQKNLRLSSRLLSLATAVKH